MLKDSAVYGKGKRAGGVTSRASVGLFGRVDDTLQVDDGWSFLGDLEFGWPRYNIPFFFGLN